MIYRLAMEVCHLGCFSKGLVCPKRFLFYVYICILYTNYTYMLLQSGAACYIYLYEI